MPRVPDLVGRIRLDTRDLALAEAKVRAFAASTATSLSGLDKSLGNFQSTISKTGAGLTDFGKKASLMASVPIVAGLGFATKAAVDFDRQMRNVNSISGMSAEALAATSDEVVRLSTTLPQSASTLAAGLYDIASSGFQGAEGLTVLEASAQAASAGLTDTATSAKGITAVLNAYGLGAADAGRVSDVLFQTVNKGVVTFEELSLSLGDFVGTASQAGVSIEEAAAALATMTLSGISGAEAATSLNQVFRALIDPSAEMAAKLDELGLGLSDLSDPAVGLRGVMDALRVATGGNIEALVGLFPEIRGARGALALMANDGKNAADVFASFIDETKLLGSTQRALAEQAKSAAFQYDVLRNRLNAVGIEIGNQLIPSLLTVANVVADVAGAFSALPDEAQTFVLLGLAATAAVGPIAYLAGNLLKVRAALDLATAAAAKNSFSTGVMVAGLRGAAVRLAGVAGALYTVKTAADAARDDLERVGKELEEDRGGGFWDRLREAIPFGQSFNDAARGAAKSAKDAQPELAELAVQIVNVDKTAATTGNALEGLTEDIDGTGEATKRMAEKVEAALGATEALVQAEFDQADALDRFTAASNDVVDKERELRDARNARGDATRDAITIERALNAVEDAASSVLEKEKDLAAARAGRGRSAREIVEATRALKDAQQEYNEAASKGAGRDKERAAERLADAQQRLADAQAEGGQEGDIKDATEALSRAQLDAKDAALSLSEAREQAATREAAATERIRAAEEALVGARRNAVQESVALAQATRALNVLQAESVGKTVEAEARYRLMRDELIRVKDTVAPGSELHRSLIGIVDALPPPEVKFKIVAETEEALRNLAMIGRAQELLGVKLPFGLDFTGKKFHSGGLAPLAPGRELPAVLRSGEFVIREEIVRKLGAGFFARLNAGRLPRFHDGGLVPPSLRVPQLAGAAASPQQPGATHNWNVSHQDADYIVAEVKRRLDWDYRRR